MNIPVIPVPVRIREINGESFLNEKTEITVSNDNTIPPEGYTLSLDNNRLHISKSDSAGEFYARQTVKQISAVCGGKCGNFIIEDYPRFAHRGFMIDCCRHFFNVNQLKELIDTAALFKLNIFHWHLTDDQGWRLPVKGRPELCEIGGKRKNSLFGGVDEGKEYAFSFTEAEIKEIVDYCAERYIEVIPEIEMPGHSTSALAVYPELGCTGEKVEVTMKEGIFDTVLCLGNPETMIFVKDILDKVCEMFPGRYIHIGGDEAPRTKWKKCPACTKKMQEYGITSYDEFQGRFIKEAALYLKSKGKTAISWNESLKGNVLSPDDLIVQRWMEKGNASADFANAGGRIIESDFYHYYCDYPYGMTPVSKTYNWKPVIKKIKSSNSVMGVEAEMWTEYIRSFDQLKQKLFPRMFAVAEAGWSPESRKNYGSFKDRVNLLRPLLSEMNINVIPENEWSLLPHRRLADIFKFFKGSISITALKNTLNNNKTD